MRAGKLDRVINIESFSSTQDEFGSPIEEWTAFVTGLRAQIVQSSTAEFFSNTVGEGATSTIIFRTRFVDGVTNLHRIVYDGRNFDIEEVKELGRRQGLELRARAPE